MTVIFHPKWNDHDKDIANDSYGVWSTLRKLKYFTDWVRDLQSRLYFCGSTIVTKSIDLCQDTC